MLKACTVILVALLLILPASAQNKTASKTSEPTVKTGNPVKPTAESIASGKKYFGYDCAMCHGENADGKGTVAIDEKYDLKDFNDPAALKDHTDDELFRLIKTGKGHMPLEQIRSTPNEIWNLINYIRSLPKSTQEAATPQK